MKKQLRHITTDSVWFVLFLLLLYVLGSVTSSNLSVTSIKGRGGEGGRGGIGGGQGAAKHACALLNLVVAHVDWLRRNRSTAPEGIWVCFWRTDRQFQLEIIIYTREAKKTKQYKHNCNIGVAWILILAISWKKNQLCTHVRLKQSQQRQQHGKSSGMTARAQWLCRTLNGSMEKING